MALFTALNGVSIKFGDGGVRAGVKRAGVKRAGVKRAGVKLGLA